MNVPNTKKGLQIIKKRQFTEKKITLKLLYVVFPVVLWSFLHSNL